MSIADIRFTENTRFENLLDHQFVPGAARAFGRPEDGRCACGERMTKTGWRTHFKTTVETSDWLQAVRAEAAAQGAVDAITTGLTEAEAAERLEHARNRH